MNRNQNYNCDNDKCTSPDGEVRVYPLGSGGNLLLCRACWAYENNYRASRGGERADWPLLNWEKAEVYSNG